MVRSASESSSRKTERAAHDSVHQRIPRQIGLGAPVQLVPLTETAGRDVVCPRTLHQDLVGIDQRLAMGADRERLSDFASARVLS